MKGALNILLDVEAVGFFVGLIGFKLWIKAKAHESPIVFLFGNPPGWGGTVVILAVIVVGLLNVVWISSRLHNWRNRKTPA